MGTIRDHLENEMQVWAHTSISHCSMHKLDLPCRSYCHNGFVSYGQLFFLVGLCSPFLQQTLHANCLCSIKLVRLSGSAEHMQAEMQKKQPLHVPMGANESHRQWVFFKQCAVTLEIWPLIGAHSLPLSLQHAHSLAHAHTANNVRQALLSCDQPWNTETTTECSELGFASDLLTEADSPARCVLVSSPLWLDFVQTVLCF